MQNPYENPGAPIPPPNAGGPAPGGASPVNATMLLVMGILSIICCSILGPVTWVMANNAQTTLNSYGGTDSDKQLVNIAKILGIIGSVLLVLGCIWTIFSFFIAGTGFLGAGVPGAAPATPPVNPPNF